MNIINWILFILAIPAVLFLARAIVDTINPRTKAAMLLEKMVDRSLEDAQEKMDRSILRFKVWEIEEEKRRGSDDS